MYVHVCLMYACMGMRVCVGMYVSVFVFMLLWMLV